MKEKLQKGSVNGQSQPRMHFYNGVSKILYVMGYPHGSVINNYPPSAGDLGSIPGLGRSLREGNGYPLQYSCLENPMNRGAWQATVYGVAKIGHDLVVSTFHS